MDWLALNLSSWLIHALVVMVSVAARIRTGVRGGAGAGGARDLRRLPAATRCCTGG